MHVSIKIMMKYIFTRARTSNNRIHIPPNPRIVHYIYTPNYRNGCERKFAFQLAYRGNTLDTAGARAGRKLVGFSDICLSKLRTGVCALIVHLCVYVCVCVPNSKFTDCYTCHVSDIENSVSEFRDWPRGIFC